MRVGDLRPFAAMVWLRRSLGVGGLERPHRVRDCSVAAASQRVGRARHLEPTTGTADGYTRRNDGPAWRSLIVESHAAKGVDERVAPWVRRSMLEHSHNAPHTSSSTFARELPHGQAGTRYKYRAGHACILSRVGVASAQ